jgi:hypothetical protein
MADSGTKSRPSGADKRDFPFEKRGYVPEPPRVPPVPPKGGTAVVSWPFARVPAPAQEETSK